jgi:pimeloyl-ACP methyl ester carboxylesterase
VLLALALAVAGVFVLGTLFNAIAGAILRARYPPPGAYYTVDGRAMHLFCAGTGSPTVLLEGGLGDDWLYWQKVQPALVRTVRVCSYDRAGIGWSEPQPGRRDAKVIAAQLHALLARAGERGPFLLVGASAGAFYVRLFAAMYPEDTIAIVFVDGSVPDQIRLPGREYSEAVASARDREARLESIEDAIGWSRLIGRCRGEVESGLEAYAGIARATACRPRFATSWLGEWKEFWQSADEAAAARCCDEMPIAIVSQDPDRPKTGWTAQAIADQRVWNRLQESLKGLSPRNYRIIARGSGHHVMIDRPDVVIEVIGRLVTSIRGGTTPAEYGSTVVR